MPRHKNIKFTLNNLMLDEVQSLLKKSIQRKDAKYVLSCINELSTDNIQLPSSLLVDCLFGDHCLCDAKTLANLYFHIENKEKKQFIELLLKTNACNISWCLPVISLEHKYHIWGNRSTAHQSYENLVEEKEGFLRFDVIMTEFVNAWNSRDEYRLIAYANLLHVIQERELRIVKQRGIELMKKIVNYRCKPKIVMLTLALLYGNRENDGNTKDYMKTCFLFSCMTGVNLSLILFFVIAFRMYGTNTNESPTAPSVDWDSRETLNKMPGWAVDISTYRGLSGKATVKHLDANQKQMLGDEGLREFHGARPRSTVEDMLIQLPTNNKFSNRTREIYSCYPEKEQNLYKMIKRFYLHLREEHSFLCN